MNLDAERERLRGLAAGIPDGPWGWFNSDDDEPWNGEGTPSLRTLDNYRDDVNVGPDGQHEVEIVNGLHYTHFALPKFLVDAEQVEPEVADILAAVPDMLALIDAQASALAEMQGRCAETVRQSALYFTVHAMMLHLGMVGEIDTRHPAVTLVMNTLTRIDAGNPNFETMNNAARYVYLRERDLDAIGSGGVFAGMTPKNVVLNGDDLDRAIDDAIRALGKGT